MPVRPGSVRPVPPPLPEVFFARDHRPADVAARVRSGAWEPVCRGAYVVPGSLSGPADRALARIVGLHRRVETPHWFSRESAALLWGLPVWQSVLVTHLRQTTKPGQHGRDPTVVRHVAPVPDVHRGVVSDLPVTSLALTVADCARSLPTLDVLVVTDGALRAGVDLDEVRTLLGGRGRHGVQAAERVLAAADPGAESAPETALRYHLVVDGLPVPQTQVPITTCRGTFWADLGYPHLRVAIEYDGRTKYTDQDAWFREKRRLDAIVEAGWLVIRITAEDLRNPRRLVARIRRALSSREAIDHIRQRGA
ncbi:MAG: hypothetical protein FWH11_06505 [Micrococcales bacterium]|nr:hypothetical protein [Micrococcales bacterium]